MKLELKNLYKDFESRTFLKKERASILENINLTVDEGDILGLIGKNGAGKTTLLKMIVGLIEPSDGKIVFKNKERPLFGYTSCSPRSFFWRLSSRDNLIFYGKMLGLNNKGCADSIDNISNILGITHILDMPFMHLSSGQMQSVNIARAILKKPDFLLLDEPTTSLDYEASIGIINALKKYLNEYRIPAIWCSHDYFELNRVCNKFGLLKDKKLFYKDSRVDAFHELAINYEFEISCSDIEKVNSELSTIVKNRDDKTCYFSLVNSKRDLNDVLNLLKDLDIKILSIEKNFKYFESYVS